MTPSTNEATTASPQQADQPTLLLGSSSRYRRLLLERIGLPFTTASPNIDESRMRDEAPAELVQRLAQQKAQALVDQHPNHLIIGSDQVAVLGDEVLGKPGTVPAAEAQLARLSGQRVHFLTGLSLLNSRSGALQTHMDTTEVAFRTLPVAEIKAYVEHEQPLDCAGSFKSEGLGVALFKHIQTQDPAALIGLPLVLLCEMLRAEGMNPLG